MGATHEQRVIDTFVELADTIASDYDVADFLHLLVERCAEVLGVETGGVALETPAGTLDLAAATSPGMRELENLEISETEGPCLDAYRAVTQVAAEDLREETGRWPKVAPKALELGLRSVHAFPLRLRRDCIGALNLYRETAGPFRDKDVRLAQAFADIAAMGILQERKVRSAERRAEQLQGALESRVLIERASGIIAERYRLSPQEAFDALRRHARSHNRLLRELCQDIIEGRDQVRL